MSRIISQAPPALPAELQSELAQLDRRLRWVSFAQGFGWLLFVSFVLVTIFLLTDFYFPLSGTVRFLLLTVLCTTILGLCYRWLVLPLTRKRRWPELAYLIDCSFPELQERVSSTVELSLAEKQNIFESQFMRNRLQYETNKRLTQIDMWDVLSLRSMAIALVGATLLGLVLAFPFVLNSSGYSLLWQRLLTPWSNLDSASNLTFVIEEGDRTIPRGNDALILAKPKWRYHEGTLPREIRLTWSDAHGNTTSREMSYDSGRGVYVGKIPQLMTSITYSLTSNRARSREYNIEVADRPRIVNVTLTVEPPAYTNKPTSTIEGAIGTIRVIEGSQLTAQLSFEHPVTEASWVWETPRLAEAAENETEEEQSQAPNVAEAILPARLSGDRMSATVSLKATQNDEFHFHVVSPDGLRNTDEPTRVIQIIPDRAPRIDLAGSGDPRKIKPNDALPIDIQADDDFGLMEVGLVVEHLSAAKSNAVIHEWTSEKTGEDVTFLNEEFELDLALLDLKAGDIVGYRAYARDGRPEPGPNETWTSRRVLMIDGDVKTISGQEVEDFYTDVKRQAEMVKDEVRGHRKEIQRHREELDPKPREEAVKTINEKKVEWTQKKLSLKLQLDDLSRKLESRPITEALSRMQVEPARELIEQTAQALEEFEPEQPSDGIDTIRKQEEQLFEAEQSLDQLVHKLGDAERIEEELTELQQLGRRAERLANEADSLNRQEPAPETEKQEPSEAPEMIERQPLEKLRDEWSALSHDLENLLKRRPELKQAAKNAILSELQLASETARQLAEQQDRVGEATRIEQERRAESRSELKRQFQTAADLAEELAMQAAREAEQTAAPLFDASPTREAVKEEESGNEGTAAERLEEAREALERFQQAREQSEPLSKDQQQAARQLAERTRKLEEKAKRWRERQKGWKQQAEQLQKDRKSTADDELDEEQRQQRMTKAKELEAREEDLETEQQQLAEELSGLSRAVAALQPPLSIQTRKKEALDKLDQAADELLAESDRTDDRLRDAANKLESLSDQIGSPPERADSSKKQLETLQQRVNNLAEQLDKAAEEDSEQKPEARAGEQLQQVRDALATDTMGEEQKLAEAIQQAMQAQEKLKRNQAEQAAEAQKKFAEKLAELNEAIQQKSEENAADSPETAANPASNPKEEAWKKTELPPELKALRFPENEANAEQLARELEKIAEQQEQLRERTERTVQEHSSPDKRKELENKLKQLTKSQNDLAEQMRKLSGNEAQLPRMQAQRSQQKASEALKQADASQTQQAQKRASQQLQQALDQLKRDTEPADSEKKRDSRQLADQLRSQLEEMQRRLSPEQLAQQPNMPETGQPAGSEEPPGESQQPMPAEDEQPASDAESATAESASTPDDQKLQEALKGLMETQERIATQAEQLAKQNQLEHPDQEATNEMLSQAATQARQAEQKMQAGQLAESQKQAEGAGQSMGQAAEDGETSEQGRETASQLAAQQQEVAERLSELAENPQARQMAREQSQQNLQQQTEGLSEALSRLSAESQAKPIDEDRNAKQLSEMSTQSQGAAESMRKALQQSRQRNLQSSQQAARQASEQLRHLAEQAAQLANTKRDTLVPEPVGDEAAQASRQLAEAQQSLEEALREQAKQGQQQNSGNQQQPSPPQANQQQPQPSEGMNEAGNDSGEAMPMEDPSALQQLAEQLSQASRSLNQAHENLQPKQGQQNAQQMQAQAESSPGDPSQDSESMTGNQSMMSGDEALGAEAIRSALMRDWGQRVGELEAELSDGRRRKIDQEYAPLIRSYFESLSAPERKTYEE